MYVIIVAVTSDHMCPKCNFMDIPECIAGQHPYIYTGDKFHGLEVSMLQLICIIATTRGIATLTTVFPRIDFAFE